MTDRLNMDFGHDLIDNGTSDDDYTPPFIFEALGLKFDMNVCAPSTGVPWIPAKQSISVIENGLVTPWNGLVWCNPPFSNISPWIDKMEAHGNGIALVGLLKSRWCNNAWDRSGAIMLLPSNLKFIKSNGNPQSILNATMLIGYGDQAISAMNLSNLGRVR